MPQRHRLKGLLVNTLTSKMQVELRKSEILRVDPEYRFLSLPPHVQKRLAVLVLSRRGDDQANFVADQILRGNLSYEFVVADDISQLT